MNRSGEKRVGARQEKSPLFTKITREMNQLNIDEQIIAIYIWEINGGSYIFLYIKKIMLSRPWTFDNDSDFVQFLTSNDVRIRKYSSMFIAFPGKIHLQILNGI